LLIGFESLNQEGLIDIHKGSTSRRLPDRVDALHAQGIAIQGCFVSAWIATTVRSSPKPSRGCWDLRIDIPRYSIYTPYPGPVLPATDEQRRI